MKERENKILNLIVIFSKPTLYIKCRSFKDEKNYYV